jgi:hypothetical protein
MKSCFSFSVIARAVCIVLLFYAVTRHPYSYYIIMRWVVCGTAAYVSYLSYTSRRVPWSWTFGLIALLFNPFKSTGLGRATWAYVDVVVGIVFLISCFFVREKPSAKKGKPLRD